MTDLKEAARMALEALTSPEAAKQPYIMSAVAQTLLRAALEAPEAEPVAWRWVPSAAWGSYVVSGDKARAEQVEGFGLTVQPLYAAPQPAREPVRLTEIEFAEAAGLISLSAAEYNLCRAIERAVLAANGLDK